MNDDETSVLIVLDVDGTISRIYREDEYREHRYDEGWTQMMPFDQDVIAALHDQALRPEVQVAWLTSWDQDGVEWLIQHPLGGRLDGAYVPHQGWPDRGWRFRSLLAYLEEIRPQAVVWADDMAPVTASRRIQEQTGIPALVIRPDMFDGVALADVQRIGSFIDNLRIGVDRLRSPE